MADPFATEEEIRREYDFCFAQGDGRRYDLVVGAVAHREYRDLADEQLAALVVPGGTLADLKGIWRDRELGAEIDRWTL